ncbi:M23 family metallopeptidase [Sporosarcina sp. ITBMC105]
MVTSLFMLFILIVLPIVTIWMLARATYKTKLEWLLDAVKTVALVAWLVHTQPWDWIGYYIRYLLVILLVVALFLSWKKVNALPFRENYTMKRTNTMGLNIVLIVFFGAITVSSIFSYSVKDKAIELAFPMHEGTYYVGHGGNHTSMNYHHAYDDQKYALDIVKLNKIGTRANGLQPKELTKYEIFGDELLSPCNGKVSEVRDGLQDMTPPKMDREHPEGNFVALFCEQHDATIYMAHMKEGSVAVAKGDTVTTGQLLGKVGNSGNTSEPHLHIHAELDGKGVPLTFDGRFLVRNQLVKTGGK